MVQMLGQCCWVCRRGCQRGRHLCLCTLGVLQMRPAALSFSTSWSAAAAALLLASGPGCNTGQTKHSATDVGALIVLPDPGSRAANTAVAYSCKHWLTGFGVELYKPHSMVSADHRGPLQPEGLAH
jgi:hypothetical protein